MKIVKLSSKNVKRLTAVEIEPDGDVVVIGGKNGAGKSSVLDSIAYALGGKEAICKRPVRDGQERAEVICEFEDLIVRRTFTAAGGGTLTVKNRDGARYDSPQTMLDRLTGKISFDPLIFTRMTSAKQAESLRTHLGLDFSELDSERASVFSKRTEVNRDGKNLRARFEALPAFHEGVPEEETATSALVEELEEAQAQNSRNEDVRRGVSEARSELDEAQGRVAEQDRAIEKMREELRGAVEAREALVGEVNAANDECERREKAAADLVDVDTNPITKRMSGLDETNRKVRENVARTELGAQLEAKRAESAALTERIESIDEQKRLMISSAEFPVERARLRRDGRDV